MAEQKAFYFNQNYCVGCHACETACKVTNEIDVGVKWRKVDTIEKEIGGRLVEMNLSHACMHCAKPACAEVCPVKAYTKREEDGIVYQDHDKCIGCGQCVAACPYQVPVLNTKVKKAEKCDMCLELLEQGEDPACVQGCPLQVLKINDLSKLDAEGAVKECIGFAVFATDPSIRFAPIRKR
ncbi:MAG TPA: 4Fe-4S dicluster domain-containing protein [Desulfitobacterium dehalogenans]|uniref:4Fe-4S dicluster domain-containing protein n=1 Tax=Desulfitobacterium dehalogenans TaxID=36854 RepID=A0A7C7D9N7_9FIRM|nr:4Fe-4S dicluster domain-containing protein [Desulfitobacterium dehalogenans]